MYELVVVACLIAQPTKCEEFPLPFQPPMGIMECMRESQLHLVQWLAEHSDWEIRKWSCKVPQA
jgi:hypothetical protein